MSRAIGVVQVACRPLCVVVFCIHFRARLEARNWTREPSGARGEGPQAAAWKPRALRPGKDWPRLVSGELGERWINEFGPALLAPTSRQLFAAPRAASARFQFNRANTRGAQLGHLLLLLLEFIVNDELRELIVFGRAHCEWAKEFAHRRPSAIWRRPSGRNLFGRPTSGVQHFGRRQTTTRINDNKNPRKRAEVSQNRSGDLLATLLRPLVVVVVSSSSRMFLLAKRQKFEMLECEFRIL